MSDGTYLVDCPCCKARIEVGKKTGKVLRHWEKPEVKSGADPMAEALKKIREDKSRLNDYFSGAGASMEEKKKELLDKFEQEKKRIKDSGDTSKPINPMDLD
ncbi:MAG: hypothetical protein A2X34_08140 [Elusimicrobia bacterium GWC2_51_8]|nr:MAG: hypothetical protein A2X33_11310 [Elusimicrobia bacterium GWA2_51_34]OGR65218.1 MAG: hypothetical protein A2X34_08140 [Elusimicrobia bacterium GWC2_51_8]OGR84535.1 MAG: hypothetical protein A2021_05180 [Elusimicrobia bacterium GWF2_52_66]HAF96422.1 hypothetical protein [Elusimicrobiota bacterium]HCE97258.1 hypothetical protein [Elusimicrobiota bacterium]